jgi:sugar O-acyltransferase (sialic acid O-acetyltransferase NeuD family)
MMHILGASGHAKVIVEILKLNLVEILGVWDDNPEMSRFLDYPISGNIVCFKASEDENCIVAIGNNELRREIVSKLHCKFGCALHPTCYISPSVKLGEGLAVMPHATINSFAVIGDHVIINTNASVDHDCIIEDYVHVSPQVAIGGNVEVGQGTHIGIGACVIQGIKIGKWATVGAGAVVIRDVPDYAVVVGNPAKIIKYTSR